MELVLLFVTLYISQTSSVLDYTYSACKFTSTGSEYIGDVTETKNGLTCMEWSKVPTKLTRSLSGLNFPDGSMRRARNRCRNPNNNSRGPWCFVFENDYERMHCYVPFCRKAECRMTGVGLEYSGTQEKSISGKGCVKWTAAPEATKNEQVVFGSSFRVQAKSYCRNPTESVAGPWCYVTPQLEKDMVNTSYVPELCDIPLCNFPECGRLIGSELAAVGKEYLDHYHVMYSSVPLPMGNNISFGIKLWQPDKWKSATLSVAVTATPVPASGYMLKQWGTGFEVNLTNIRYKLKKNVTSGMFLNLFSGLEWYTLRVKWNATRVEIYKEGLPLAIESIPINYKYLEVKPPTQSQYISVKGSLAMVDMPCNAGIACTEYITHQYQLDTIWPLERAVVGKQLTVFLRSVGAAVIHLLTNEFETAPSIRLEIWHRPGSSRLILAKRDNSEEIVGMSKEIKISYWKWSKLYILIALGKLKVFVKNKEDMLEVINYTGYINKLVKSFSVGSNKTSHWTIYCTPSGILEIPDPIQPECSVSQSDADYAGTLWVTENGNPCLPWTASSTKNLADTSFVDESKVLALNHCRNVGGDKRGPYCYVDKIYSEKSFKEHCKPQKCLNFDCKVGGLGNDFIGEVNISSSGRLCQPWRINEPHTVEFKEAEQFPDRSMTRVSNWCRNPSADLGGPWCYTVDPHVVKDLCQISDCYKQDECTVIIKGIPKRKYVFSPDMQQIGLSLSMKLWDSSSRDIVVITLYIKHSKGCYKLLLGSDDNEKVELIYTNPAGVQKVIWSKSLGYLLSAAKWVGVSLLVRNGQISVRFEGFLKPTFVSPLGETSHEIEYWSLGTLNGHPVGFNLDKKGHYIEETNPSEKGYVKYNPINSWKPNIFNNETKFNEFKIFMSGGATTVKINLLGPLSNPPLLTVLITGGIDYKLFAIQEYTGGVPKEVNSFRSIGTAILNNSWTEIVVMFNETYINVYHNGTHMVKWSPKNKLILYYFTIDSTKAVLWTANIPPPYLVGTPINGEWSEWIAIRCSVSCGGGTGIRLRTCTNPSPSLEGRPCLGPDMEKSRCNVRRCGTLSESSREYFKDGLRHSISYRVLKGEPLELGVEQHAVDRLRAEMPDAHIRWARNGLNLTPLKPLNTSLPEDYYLNISSASYNDSGTYICMVLSPLQEVTVIHIYAVSVYSLEPSLELSIGSEFSPECKSLYLLYFFNKLYHHWVLNQSKDVVELPIEKFHSESKFTIKVTKEHSGIWECVVKSDRLNITWVTNWIYLEVYNPFKLSRVFKMLGRYTYFGMKGTLTDSKASLVILVVLTIIIVTIFQSTFSYWMKLANYVPWWERDHKFVAALERSRMRRARELRNRRLSARRQRT